VTSDHPENPADRPEDQPDRPEDQPDRPGDRLSQDPDPTRPARSPAETRSRTEYYVDLRTKVSAEQTAESGRTAADQQAAEAKWQKDSAESRSIWAEYQRKWPPASPAETDKPSSQDASYPDRTRSLDDATNRKVEAECDLIADRERDKITPALQSIESQDPDRHLVGLDHRLKGRDRIKEKVNDGIKFLNHSPEEAVSLVPDAIRYTFQYQPDRYTRGVWLDIGRLREQGFELYKLKNSWSGDQYKGVNSQWVEPGTGQRFEVQFHTRISFEAKQLTHKAYERLRTKQPDDLEELVLEAFQKKVAAGVPVPPGANDIPDYPERHADAR
jgi:hypothetical protein